MKLHDRLAGWFSSVELVEPHFLASSNCPKQSFAIELCRDSAVPLFAGWGLAFHSQDLALVPLICILQGFDLADGDIGHITVTGRNRLEDPFIAIAARKPLRHYCLPDILDGSF